jgi:hypothetical protein
LLDEEEIDDDNHPMVGLDSRRRNGSTPITVARSVRISQGILILFVIFFVGMLILGGIFIF